MFSLNHYYIFSFQDDGRKRRQLFFSSVLSSSALDEVEYPNTFISWVFLHLLPFLSHMDSNLKFMSEYLVLPF